MSTEQPRLSENARRYKRNLLLFSAISWALLVGWIEPAPQGVSTVAGIGFQISHGHFHLALSWLIAHSLVMFWLHSSLGVNRKKYVSALFFSPWILGTLDWAQIIERLKQLGIWDKINGIFRAQAEKYREDAKQPVVYSSSSHGESGRFRDMNAENGVLDLIWNDLTFVARLKLRIRSLWYADSRRWQLEPILENWFPIGFGGFGLFWSVLSWVKTC